MLILAGVGLSAITGADGIMTRAEKAGEIHNNAALNEAEEINDVLSYIQSEENKKIIGNGNYSEKKGVNRTKLVEGMSPVIWDEETQQWQLATNENSWYDYKAQETNTINGGTSKWANAKTADGSYWVWLPRYAYKITSGYHTTTAGEIEVKFLKGNTNEFIDGSGFAETNPDNITYTGDSQNQWLVHPAFTNNPDKGGWDRELEGIWVGKFENSNSNGKVKIAPNVTSWRNINVKTMFNHCLDMSIKNYETYGFAYSGVVDTHMLKVTEWGAIAYLAHSKYGRNGTEVSVNNSSGYFTGRSSGTPTPNATTAQGTYTYEHENGVLASTTGNIYGVYDMSGGAGEYFMSKTTNQVSSSGFTTLPESKYIIIYSGYNSSIKGDCRYETSTGLSNASATGWFGDYTHENPSPSFWLMNLGCSESPLTRSGLFGISQPIASGGANGNYSFRTCLIPYPSE